MASDSNLAIVEIRGTYYRWLFIAATIWNVLSAASVSFLLTKPRFRSEWGFPGPPDGISLHLLATCLLVFGLGYHWVSRDLSQNRDLVKLGVVGKPMVFLVFFWHALSQEIPMVLVLPSVVDLLFGALFLEFLLRSRKSLQ